MLNLLRKEEIKWNAENKKLILPTKMYDVIKRIGKSNFPPKDDHRYGMQKQLRICDGYLFCVDGRQAVISLAPDGMNENFIYNYVEVEKNFSFAVLYLEKIEDNNINIKSIMPDNLEMSTCGFVDLTYLKNDNFEFKKSLAVVEIYKATNSIVNMSFFNTIKGCQFDLVHSKKGNVFGIEKGREFCYVVCPTNLQESDKYITTEYQTQDNQTNYAYA